MALNQSQQIYEAIKKSKNILIVFPPNHDGDTLAGSLALNLIFKKLDKKIVTVSHQFELNKKFAFLPSATEIQNSLNNLKKLIISLDLKQKKLHSLNYHVKNNKLNIFLEAKNNYFDPQDLDCAHSKYSYDLIICLKSPDLESLDQIYEQHTDFFYSTPILNIDHSVENEHYGHYNLVEVTATSLGEIIFNLLEKIDLNLIDEQIATCLLTGMIEKTKSFKIPQVTPQSLNIASQLIALGARRDEIIKNLYQTKSITSLQLWGKILQNLQTNEQQTLAWSQLHEENSKITAEEAKEIIEEMVCNIPNVSTSVIIFNNNQEKQFFIKTEKNINLLEIFCDYKPEGTKSFVTIKTNESEWENKILNKLQ